MVAFFPILFWKIDKERNKSDANFLQGFRGVIFKIQSENSSEMENVDSLNPFLVGSFNSEKEENLCYFQA